VVSQREIARRLGISRVTVKRALDSQGPPGYESGPRSSGFDAFQAQVMLLLRDFSQMPVTVVAQRVGWPGSITKLRHNARWIWRIGWNRTRVISVNVIYGSHR